jgi:hypothetical protein
VSGGGGAGVRYLHTGITSDIVTLIAADGTLQSEPASGKALKVRTSHTVVVTVSPVFKLARNCPLR